MCFVTWLLSLVSYFWNVIHKYIFDVLSDLVPFVQFKKREKEPWRSGAFTKKPVTLLKVTLLYGCFSLVLNCTDGTKSQKAHLISDTKHFAKDMFFGGYHNYKPYRLLWRGVLQKNCHFQFVEFISSYSSISR